MTLEDLGVLVGVAHHYERSMGPMRFVVPVLAGREVKAKYRFVAEESRWLERFAVTTRDELAAVQGREAAVRFTPLALVAYWGRLLASLDSRRTRRKLSPVEVEARRTLAARLEAAARRLHLADPAALESALSTRRPVEAQWMRDTLIERSSEAQ